MNAINWKQWLEHGSKYEAAGRGKNGAASRLAPSIAYNMLAMALESYCMAILDYNGTLPDNHTFTDLVNALRSVSPLEADLEKRILQQERVQQICSFQDFVIANPDAVSNQEFADVIRILGDKARAECNPAQN